MNRTRSRCPRSPVSRALLGSLTITAIACSEAPASRCERLGGLCEDPMVTRFDAPRSSSVTVDLDGDGQAELVTALPDLGLAIGWQQGRRREYRRYPGGAADVALADVDGDGDEDVLFITVEPPQLHVLDNTGSAQSSETATYEVKGRPESLWVGALDDDPRADAIVATSIESGLTIFTEGLTRDERLELGDDLVAVEVGDLGGDGELDIVAADFSASALYVVPAGGKGTPVKSPSGPGPEFMQLFDLDGDEVLDVLTHGSVGPEIWWHRGTGAGMLAAPQPIRALEAASDGFGAIRDANGVAWIVAAADGRVAAIEVDAEGDRGRRVVNGWDLNVQSVGMAGDVVLARGDGEAGSFGLELATMFTEVWREDLVESYGRVVLGDLVTDGLLDLAVRGDDSELKIYAGGPDGRWRRQGALILPIETLEIAAADVTGDGVLDLALGQLEGVQIAIGVGDGSFTLAPRAALFMDAWEVQAFDPAGSKTAAVALSGGDFPGQGVTVVKFDGAGHLVEQTEPLSSGQVRRLGSADVDQDGDDELVALHEYGGDTVLEILAWDGETWSPPVSHALNQLLPGFDDATLERAAFGLGDLDDDGRVDAAIVIEGAIVRLHDIGADVPEAEIEGTPGSGIAEHVAIANVDDDGMRDVIMVNAAGVTVDFGGEEATPPRAAYAEYSKVAAIVVGPEGQPTIATLSDHAVSLLAPGLAPELAREEQFAMARHAGRIVAGDFDGDGRADVFVGEPDDDGSSRYSVLWGVSGASTSTGMGADMPAILAACAAPLDDRPGDELLIGNRYEVSAWGAVDGTLTELARTDVALYGLARMAVLARPGEPDDVVLSDETRLYVLPRLPSGAFTGETVALGEGPISEGGVDFAVGDLDADGFSDVVMRPGRGRHVQVVWGDRERTADTTFIDIAPTAISAFGVGDLDGDARPEVVVGTPKVTVSVGFDGRQARAPVAVAPGCLGWRVLLADVAGDGAPDVVCEGDVRIGIHLRAPGRAGEDLALEYPGYGVHDTHLVELDGDGILDVVAASGGSVVTWLSSRTPS